MENLEQYIQKAKENLESWFLLQLNKEEQLQWVSDYIVPKIAQITLSSQDRVEEVVVVEQLFDLVSEALQTAELSDAVIKSVITVPENTELPQDTINKIREDFSAYLKQLKVRTALIDHLIVSEDVSPDVQFIRLVTYKMRVQGFMQQWDQQIGFSQSLQSMGCPFAYNFDEMKMIFGVYHALSLFASNQAPQSESPMFRM